jgi:p-aminobenzoyl-glutamate transporter AbgT
MNLNITVNFWFLVSMCLIFALIGVWLGSRFASRGDRYRY